MRVIERGRQSFAGCEMELRTALHSYRSQGDACFVRLGPAGQGGFATDGNNEELCMSRDASSHVLPREATSLKLRRR